MGCTLRPTPLVRKRGYAMNRWALSALCTAAFSMLPATGSAQEPPARLSWQTFEKDATRIASLRKAVAVLKARNTAPHDSPEYRKSWQYWAAMHGYLGPNAINGTVASYRQWAQAQGNWRPEFAAHFDRVKDLTRPEGAEAVWDQCQHGTPWFLAWHRLYLQEFEKLLQEAAGDPKLRLPYWDYTDPEHTGFPTAFSQPTYRDATGAVVENPLYEPMRAEDWKQPNAALDPDGTRVDGLLRLGSFTRFQYSLESTIHGAVHCAVMDCPIVAMGATAYSANDPIFWLHHANIDRLWSCWDQVDGHDAPNAADFRSKRFVFPDVSGTPRELAVASLFAGTAPVRYEQQTACARATETATERPLPAASLEAAREAFSKEFTLASAPAFAVSGSTTVLELQPAIRPASGTQLEQFVVGADPRIPLRVELRIGDIAYDRHPGTQLKIFLQRGDEPAARRSVGVVGFFDGPPGHHDTAAAERTTLDVTAAVRELAATQADLENIQVVVEAASGRRSNSQPKEVPQDAGLLIKDVELVVRPGN